MTGKVYHRLVSGIADGSDPTLVRPAHDWNDNHDLYFDAATRTGTTDTIAASDLATQITYNNAGGVAVSLPAANSGAIVPGTIGFYKGWFCWVNNRGAGNVVITPASGTILGGATLTLNQNQGAIIVSDGTNYTGFTTGAPLNSPAFTGAPTAPTPATADSSTSIATTAWGQANLALKAPLASPALTGTPTAPTPTPGSDSSTKICTTAFAQALVTGLAPLASPTFTGSPAAPAPVVSPSDSSTRLATTAFVVAGIVPQCGRLLYVASNQVAFKPFNGNKAKINGIIYDIPSGGVASVINNAYLNGVAGQTLGTNTFYYAYLAYVSGSLVIDWSTTGHATDSTAGNVGVEIKNGDSSRTLIGAGYIGGTTIFQDDASHRYIASWFNPRNRDIQSPNTNGATTTSTTPVTLAGAFANFITLAGEGVFGVLGGEMSQSAGSSAGMYAYIGFDSNAGLQSGFNSFNANAYQALCSPDARSVTEAVHWYIPMGVVTNGTGTFYVQVNGIVRQ